MPFLATFVALMLAADDGPWRVLTFLLLTVVSDTGAYAVGWRFGKHKLAPRISPGKTREGLLGAVAFAMAAGALCMQFLIDGGGWWQGLLLGLAVAVSATLGDLGESMIKRDLGIKDMGTLLPGPRRHHGPPRLAAADRPGGLAAAGGVRRLRLTSVDVVVGRRLRPYARGPYGGRQLHDRSTTSRSTDPAAIARVASHLRGGISAVAVRGRPRGHQVAQAEERWWRRTGWSGTERCRGDP